MTQEGSVHEVAALLDALSRPGTAEESAAQASLMQFASKPEFITCLNHLFADASQAPLHLRQLAGLLLKNQVKGGYLEDASPASKDDLKRGALKTLASSEEALRKVAGTLITTLVSLLGIASWPHLIPALCSMLTSEDLGPIEGAFDAILKLCEDNAEELDSDEASRPLNILFPSILPFLGNQLTKLRLVALSCITTLIPTMPSVFIGSMDNMLSAISGLTVDENANIRQLVCRAIHGLLLSYPEAVRPHLDNVCEFMLKAQDDSAELVGMEAAEFWQICCYSAETQALLLKTLPVLIPILLRRMPYGEDEIADFHAEGAINDHIPDRPEDIRPLFHKPGYRGDGGELGDDVEDDGEVSRWNLRKSCAATLDQISNTLGPNPILPILLPAVQEGLNNSSEWVRESCILALGAVSDGCISGMVIHLPQLLPYFLSQMDDPTPQVRSICCWTLSRYMEWICLGPESAVLLPKCLDALLRRVMDQCKMTQEAACSALSSLEEISGANLNPHVNEILHTLMQALGKYQMRSLIILYDTLGTLADSVGYQLVPDPNLVGSFMSPLMLKLASVSNGDQHLLPLMECLMSIAEAVGSLIEPYAPLLFARCLSMLELTLVGRIGVKSSTDENATPISALDGDLATCSLDLLCGITGALGAGVQSLVERSNLLVLLDQSLMSHISGMRQSACALIGDLAQASFSCIVSALPQYMPRLLSLVDPEEVLVCNNACWAIGEIAIRCETSESGSEAHNSMRNFVFPIMEKVVPLLHSAETDGSLRTNVALTISRLALAYPETLAPTLPHFGNEWCRAISCMSSPSDKHQSCSALGILVQSDPGAAVACLMSIFLVLASWQGESLPSDLHEGFKSIFLRYKANVDQAQWDKLWQNLPGPYAHYLSTVYELQ